MEVYVTAAPTCNVLAMYRLLRMEQNWALLEQTTVFKRSFFGTLARMNVFSKRVGGVIRMFTREEAVSCYLTIKLNSSDARPSTTADHESMNLGQARPNRLEDAYWGSY